MTEDDMKEAGFEPETGIFTDENSDKMRAIVKAAFEKMRAEFGLDGEFFVSLTALKRRKDGNCEYLTSTRLYSDVRDGKEAFWLTHPTVETCVALARASVNDTEFYNTRVEPVCEGGRA